MKFEIKPSGNGKYRWTLIGDNGEVLAISPVSYSKFDVNQRIKLIQATVALARIEGLSEAHGVQQA
jgi:uncharacterized protein YegP (UPF0339 family)